MGLAEGGEKRQGWKQASSGHIPFACSHLFSSSPSPPPVSHLSISRSVFSHKCGPAHGLFLPFWVVGQVQILFRLTDDSQSSKISGFHWSFLHYVILEESEYGINQNLSAYCFLSNFIQLSGQDDNQAPLPPTGHLRNCRLLVIGNCELFTLNSLE